MKVRKLSSAFFLCLCATAALAAPPQTSSAPVAGQPTANDNHHIYDLTQKFLAAEDGVDFAGARTYLSDGMLRTIPQDGWRTTFLARKAKMGALHTRKVTKVTWEQNPPWAQAGLYATVDYVASYDNSDLYCGFISWQRQPGGDYLVVREEFGGIDKKLLPKLDPATLTRFKADHHCVTAGQTTG